jgi:outer membrane receptor for ferrienterochelin and colicin
MIYKNILKIIPLLCLSSITYSQSELKGEVLELIAGKEKPIYGANVYWQNQNIGRVTNEDGKFSIPYKSNYTTLIITYVGYKADTLNITDNTYIKHILEAEANLEEVNITARKQSLSRSYLDSKNVINVSSDELLKAACCNLSESFETNPSIDVNFSDAITGTKQVKMLGLDSPYILITTENIPSIRGAIQTNGLSFIPGTWVESIQITKGAGSVVNGFESITGQINAELQKPSQDYPLFINAYAGINGRLEFNTHINQKVSDKWHTGIYIHGNQRSEKFDRNGDGFLDLPLKEQINVLNRWQYSDAEKGIISFINFKYLNDKMQSGQLDFRPESDKFTNRSWGSESDTERFETSLKFGYVNPEIPYQSLGFQTDFSYHDQASYFGFRVHDIQHTSLYSNLIYNSIISDSRHKIKTGLSFMYDSFDEVADSTAYMRNDNSFGGFFEYAFDNLSDLTLTAGIRADQHNRLGFFLTPRFHLRYTPWGKSALRVSFGRGKRIANIFAENHNLFASSRQINILNTNGSIYGLDPEIAWNFGVSYLQGFNLFGKSGDITFDFYRTDFQNQVVVDWENPTEIRFYNLNGQSFSSVFQAELNYELLDRLDLRLAYKFFDVQTDYLEGQFQKPLIPRHRFFANLGYITKLKDNGAQWKFDVTYNWLSEQRFPSTVSSPSEFQQTSETPTVGLLNAQVTRVFSDKFEIYLGGENMTDVRQPNPIINAENPFDSFFDSNFVYGPIFGYQYYVGLRFKLIKNNKQ